MLYIMFLVLSVAIIVILAGEIGMQSYRQEIRYEDSVKEDRAWDAILAQIDDDGQSGTITSLPATYTVNMNGVTGTVTVADNSGTLANTEKATATLTTADGRTYPESNLLPKAITGLSGYYWWTNGAYIQQVSDADDYVLANGAATGSFFGTVLNYSGTDSTLFKTWISTDSSSYTGSNQNFKDAIVKFLGTITTTSNNMSIQVTCDDGAIMNIDGDNYQINNDGVHASASVAVSIPTAGTYPLVLTYINHIYTAGASSAALQLQWKTQFGSYTSIPSSAIGSYNPNWVFNGSAAAYADGVQLVSNSTNQAGSAWFGTKQTISSFHCSFTFNVAGSAAGEGLTFCMQNVGTSALGSSGASLGYASTITSSAAIKFDFYSDAGENSNSTGYYTGGATPTTSGSQSIGTNPNLNGGDTMHCTLSYNGTTLTEVLTDEDTGTSYTKSYVVNISTAVGASTAYVGFTGSTGSSSSTKSTINVTDFTFGP